MPNRYRIVRLKDKLGTRDMASGEIRLEGAEAHPGGLARPRLHADGRHDQQVAAVERRARGRHDATRADRSAVHRAQSRRVRASA